MIIDMVIGDTAYSYKVNSKYAKENEVVLVAKLNPILTQGPRKVEYKFKLNKDAGMFICKAGHLATRKGRTGKKRNEQKSMPDLLFRYRKMLVLPASRGMLE